MPENEAPQGQEVEAGSRVYQNSMDDPEDPSNLLQGIHQRGTQKDSLFKVSPLRGLHRKL